MEKPKNAYELYKLMTDKFRGRINIDPLEAMLGAVQGIMDGEKIYITYNGSYVLCTIVCPTDKKKSDKMMKEFNIFFNEIMNASPIVSYNLQSEGMSEKELSPTYEWDVDDPESRIKDIVNGRAFSDNSVLHNLKVLGDRKLEDYKETKEETEEFLKNAKIYGIYKGSINDVDEINNLSEIDLYFMIESLGGHIWRCRHDMSHGRIPQIDLTEEEYALEYMVYQTKKFGVELPEPKYGSHITPTSSYRAWFEFYHNHFQEKLTPEEWNAYQRASKNCEDVSPWLPKGSWKDNLPKEEGPKLTL